MGFLKDAAEKVEQLGGKVVEGAQALGEAVQHGVNSFNEKLQENLGGSMETNEVKESVAKFCSRCGGALKDRPEEVDGDKECTVCSHIFHECDCGCHGLCDKGIKQA